ncbi:MAG TPA: acetylxylan esterase [Candidatus Saccharimonadales bacterium]|nr:acetylxylan esterase [Candidatus Saccharimonadales bacterium]
MAAMRGDPAAFISRVQRPADFDAFWADTLARVAELPLDISVRERPEMSTPAIAVAEVEFTSWQGLRIASWYVRPAGRPAGSLPALLLTPGYISEPTVPKDWADRGYAAFSLATRGKLRSNDSFNPGFPGLLTHNVVDRETYSYRGMYVDVARAVDAILALSEVDGLRIGVHGGSQGGALALVAAALRPDAILASVPGVPFLCCFLEAAELSVSWPYREITDYLRAHPYRREAMETTLAYFDLYNFAPLVRASVLMNVGLVDDVCPPEAAYATFARLAGPKELDAFEECGHDGGSYFQAPKVEAFLARHLRPSPVVRPRQ